jgi:hypothetical protein
MTRKLTLFLVCAFEIALILFVAAWTVHAKTEQLYACSQWVRQNEEVRLTDAFRETFPDKMGRNFILSDVSGNVTIVDEYGDETKVTQLGKHNRYWDIYQTLAPDLYGNDRVFFIKKSKDKMEISTVHPLVEHEYKTTCQK